MPQVSAISAKLQRKMFPNGNAGTGIIAETDAPSDDPMARPTDSTPPPSFGDLDVLPECTIRAGRSRDP